MSQRVVDFARRGNGTIRRMKMMWFHLMPYPELPDDFNTQASQRVGRHRSGVVRSRRDGRDLRHLHRSTRLRRGVRVRRHLRQRAPQQRLRADAVAQPDRRDPRQPHLAGRDHRARQLGRAVQPAAARRRGVRDARPVLARPADRRLPGRHGDGHHPLLQHEPGHACARVTTRASS